MVRNAGRARALAEAHGAATWYTSVEALLADPEIDAVYVCTPVHLHCEQTIQAARAGKHVLCEKPMALTPEEGEKMVAACTEHGRLLMLGFMQRFHTSHRQIKRLIEEGRLGQIVSARAQLYMRYPDTPGAWRQRWDTGGGGALMDLGSHCLDLLRFLLGDVTSVSALAKTRVFGYEVDDTVHALLEFTNGTQALMDAAFSIPHRQNLLEIYGTRATVVGRRTLGPFRDPAVTLITDAGEEDISLPYENTYRAEFVHFSQCIEQGCQPDATGPDGIANLELMQAIYESSRSGRKVELLNRISLP